MVNIKVDYAKPREGRTKDKALDWRSSIFWKLMTTLPGFSEVTVTPLMQNHYFSWKSLDLPSLMLTLKPDHVE